ncbi:DMT family transporter [Lutimonas vermicola]|uniref:DMT family transporter n=1 Tax=Lutimonas vermicola TaxID=414288 RepID=A0ABU9KY21_9FLAO
MNINLKQGQWIGFVYAALATIIWSGNFLIARGLNDKIPPVSLAFWRWTVATIVVFPIIIKSVYTQRKLLRQHAGYLVVTSILGVSVFNTLIYIAGQTTSALNLSLISITFPVFTIILARIFLKEPITVSKTGGVMVIIFGVILLVSKGNLNSLFSMSFAIGDVWMLLASLIFAIYSLLVKSRPLEIRPQSFLGSTFLIGLIFLSPFYLFSLNGSDSGLYDQVTIYSILYIGIFASVVAYFLWNRSVDLLGPSKASMIYYTIPIFSGILAYIFLNEKIMPVHLISGLLILSGIFIANRKAAG